jgi:hypothetical protein
VLNQFDETSRTPAAREAFKKMGTDLDDPGALIMLKMMGGNVMVSRQ